MPGRRQHTEGSVFRRSRDGRWVARADLGWRGGKRDQRLFVAATPAEAIERRAQFLDKLRGGFTMPKGRQPYVSEWMLHWLYYTARPKVEATTWDRSYRSKVEDLICPFFDRVPLPDLTEEDIEAWHRHLEGTISARTGRPLSASTIGQAHRIFSTAVKAAVSRGKLGRNPCSNVTPPRVARPEPQPPTAEEMERILARCRTWPNGARWVLALRTGLRQGEALALEWRDVKLTAPASVTVRQSAARVAGGQLVVKAPKSARSRRTVPLPAVAVEALRKLQDKPVASLAGLVFTDAKGQPVHPRADYSDWHALLDDLGIRRYRVHDCRHAVATRLLEAGADPRVVQDIMGWSTLAMTEIYQHVRPALAQRALDALDG